MTQTAYFADHGTLNLSVASIGSQANDRYKIEEKDEESSPIPPKLTQTKDDFISIIQEAEIKEQNLIEKDLKVVRVLHDQQVGKPPKLKRDLNKAKMSHSLIGSESRKSVSFFK